MNYTQLCLVLAALLPAIVLCIYVYKKDRVEKEPIGLLLLLLGLGAVSCFPAAFIEGILSNVINSIFAPFVYELDGEFFMDSIPYYLYHASDNFIGIALVEEGLKWLILILVTRKNKNFNHLFDGVIYAIFVSLGFAALENILYVTQHGFMNALMRGILSVPGHMFFAVFMGYYYSQWNVHCIARDMESDFQKRGVISVREPVSPAGYLVCSLLFPVLVHGFYDYALSIGTTLMTILFVIFVIGMYIYCFSKIKETSKNDAGENNYALAVLCMKYAGLRELVINAVKAQKQ